MFVYHEYLINDKIIIISLVINPEYYRLMFWSDWSDNPSITRSYMDGSHIRTLVSRPHVHWPNGLAIDDLHERLFWTDGRLHGVFSVDLYGNNFQMLIQQALWLPHPYSVAVYKVSIGHLSLYLSLCVRFVCIFVYLCFVCFYVSVHIYVCVYVSINCPNFMSSQLNL
jgi:hypothetical protein